jgi:hypothetical protein
MSKLCNAHKAYKAIRRPTAKCKKCLEAWQKKRKETK